MSSPRGEKVTSNSNLSSAATKSSPSPSPSPLQSQSHSQVISTNRGRYRDHVEAANSEATTPLSQGRRVNSPNGETEDSNIRNSTQLRNGSTDGSTATAASILEQVISKAALTLSNFNQKPQLSQVESRSKLIQPSSIKQSSTPSNIQPSSGTIDVEVFSNSVYDLFCSIIKHMGFDCISGDLLDSAVFDHVMELFNKVFDDSDFRLNNNMKLSDVLNLMLSVDKEMLLSLSSANSSPSYQVKWNHVDNGKDTPFHPKIYDRSKKLILCNADSTDSSSSKSHYQHPFMAELNALDYSYESFLDLSTLKPSPPSSSQPFDFVDTEESFTVMLDELKRGCDEVAICVKNNSYRSFQGIVCCILISTRYKDYFVDAIKLRDSIYKLNVITTNSSIVKVLHRAESQLLWLQRDFGVYIVNAYDTCHAAKLLRYPTVSLTHLLKIFCVESIPNKYQLADWSVRPLSKDMVQSSRSESFYLLYVYDYTRREVFESYGKDGLALVFQAARISCLQRYEKPEFWPEGFRKIIPSNFVSRFNKKKEISLMQDAVMGKLWAWRDEIARREDENLQLIMSNTELFIIGLEMPTTQEGVEACAMLSPYVRSHSREIMELIFAVTHSPVPTTISTKGGSIQSCDVLTTPTKGSSKSSSSGTNISETSSGADACMSPVNGQSANGSVQTPLYGRALHTPSKEVESVSVETADAISNKLQYRPIISRSQNFISADQISSDLYNSRNEFPEFSVIRSIDTSLKLISVADLFKQCGWEREGSFQGASADLEYRLSSSAFDPASLSPLSIKKLQEARPEMKETAYKILTTFLGQNALNIIANCSADHLTSTNDGNTSSSTASLQAHETPASPSIPDSHNSGNFQNVRSSFDLKLLQGIDMKDVVESEITEEDLFASLPSSFTDIYNLSNDIRKKNEKKKKKSDSNDSVSSFMDGNDETVSSTSKSPRQSLLVGSSNASKSRTAMLEKIKEIEIFDKILFDEKMYFDHMNLERDVTNLGPEGSLDIAGEIRWITDSSHRTRLIDAYTTEQAHIQFSNEGDDDGGVAQNTSSSITYAPTAISPRNIIRGGTNGTGFSSMNPTHTTSIFTPTAGGSLSDRKYTVSQSLDSGIVSSSHPSSSSFNSTSFGSGSSGSDFGRRTSNSNSSYSTSHPNINSNIGARQQSLSNGSCNSRSSTNPNSSNNSNVYHGQPSNKRR